MATLSSSRQKALMRKYARNVKFLMMLFSIAVIVIALPKQAKFRYEYEKGKIWNQKDLVSPYIFAILKTDGEVEADREAPISSIPPIYQFNEGIEKQNLEGFKNDFEIKWRSAALREDLKAKYIEAGYNLL